MDTVLKDNASLNRFEIEVEGEIVYAAYKKEANRLFINYVEAPVSLRGSGAAGRLMQAVMEKAKADGMKVTPICSYAASWMKRHKEYADLVI